LKRIAMLRVNPSAIGPSYARFEDLLGRRGHKVFMITWEWDGLGPQRVDFEMYRVRRLVTKLPKVPGRGIVFFLIWFVFSLKQLRDFRPEHIVGFNIDALIPALAYRLTRRVPATLYFLDSYPGAFPFGTPKALRMVFTAIEHFVSRLSDFIIFVDEARATQLSFQMLPENSTVVYNSPVAVPASAKWPFSSRAHLRVFYGGGLHRDRGIPALIDAVKTIPAVELVVAGDGPLAEWIARASRESDNVIFLGRIPHEELMKYTRASDVIPCFYDPRVPNNKLASPNKLFEAMALGKYVLTNSGQRVADYVRKHDIGSVVEYDNPTEIASQLRQLISNPDRLANVAARSPSIFQETYSWTTSLLRLDTYFKRFDL